MQPSQLIPYYLKYFHKSDIRLILQLSTTSVSKLYQNNNRPQELKEKRKEGILFSAIISLSSRKAPTGTMKHARHVTQDRVLLYHPVRIT